MNWRNCTMGTKYRRDLAAEDYEILDRFKPTCSG